LRAFHFYVLLCSALIGGFAITAKDGQIQPWSSAFQVVFGMFSIVGIAICRSRATPLA
jgi:hypothetical protein